MTAADTVRDALEGIAYKHPANNAQGNLNIAREKAALALPALDALQAVAQAARHVVDGTDPDGYLNLRAALERLDKP